MKKGNKIFEFRNALIRLIESIIRTGIIDGTIESVGDDFTCTVKVQDNMFYEVPLRVIISEQASFVEIPKIGTDCLITFRDTSNGRPQILEVHECSQIILKIGNSVLDVTNGLFEFNGGENGGIVKVEPLHTRIRNCEDKVNSILNTLKGITITLAPSGAVPFAPIFASIFPITSQSKSDIENTKIKH